MERKLVTIRRIDEIKTHPNADALELAIISGWQCVVKKDEFKEGDLVSYFEIDSLIPISEEFEFLRGSSFIKKEWLKDIFDEGECFRLRTIKLRKEISQGLVVPLPAKLKSYPEGTDITVYYGVHKYDPPVNSVGFNVGQPKGNFPSWGRKTDQERIQNLKKEFQEHYDNETKFEVTIKLDGSSLSFGISPEGEKVVCSRNLSLKLDSEDSKFVSMVNSLGVFEHEYFNLDKIECGVDCSPDITPMLIQGELIGEGIQGNKEKLTGNDFYVFDIYWPNSRSYLDVESRYAIIENLGLKHAPILHKSITLKELGLHSIEDVLRYAEGKSLFADEREGVVFKSIDGKFSFKAISNKWLLKHGE